MARNGSHDTNRPRKGTNQWSTRSEEAIDRMLDIMEERPDPIDELPDAEPIDRLVRSMTLAATSRHQVGP